MDISSHGLLPELLVLDIPEVDAQHEAIFYRIENLKYHCIEHNELPEAVVGDLLAFLSEHFATEERMAAALQLEFTEHARMHRETLTTLGGWVRVVVSGQRDVFSFLRYLEIWFERHIREEDQPFADELHEREARNRALR
ncbi:MAG: hemerythrin [Betaproteobacteria bacterium HGW-Betaproteobacteria-7]|jgi:hemerythrin-like metal-binding protein|nr:MAG: hemerythrin [Betaproteobacteria bacterium HGW-Betaproteobacteria-7]